VNLSTWGKRTALIAGAAGVVAAGAAVGLAAERYVVGKSLRGEDTEADEPLGEIHGREVPVVATDGVALHVEVDDPDVPASTACARSWRTCGASGESGAATRYRWNSAIAASGCDLSRNRITPLKNRASG